LTESVAPEQMNSQLFQHIGQVARGAAAPMFLETMRHAVTCQKLPGDLDTSTRATAMLSGSMKALVELFWSLASTETTVESLTAALCDQVRISVEDTATECLPGWRNTGRGAPIEGGFG